MTERERMKNRKAADDKNRCSRCCGRMHVHLCEWTPALSGCLNTRIKQGHGLDMLLSPAAFPCEHMPRCLNSSPLKVQRKPNCCRGFLFSFLCSLMACCYLFWWAQTLQPLTLISVILSRHESWTIFFPFFFDCIITFSEGNETIPSGVWEKFKPRLQCSEECHGLQIVCDTARWPRLM